MSQGERWAARGRTVRAAALLIAAHLLIAAVPFKVWRSRLGGSGSENPAGARRLAAQVERAVLRLPFKIKCLPQAMALSVLFGRARIAHKVVLAVRPIGHRGAGDDLHAWVEHDGKVIMGELPGPWLQLFAQGNVSAGTD